MTTTRTSDEGSSGDPPSMTGGSTPQTQRVTRWGSVGMVVGLFVLAVFSVTMAVTNDRAAARAERSAHVADMSENAQDALLAEEEAADDLLAADDEETRAAYDSASAAARRAIEALSRNGSAGAATGERDELLALHIGYVTSVAEMFDRFAGAPRQESEAEAFEDENVDVYFDPLIEALAQQRQINATEAHTALHSIRRAQQLLLVATPALFATSLAVVTFFVVKLGRSRSALAFQAEKNRYQSLHDGLTGLPNRTLLHRRSSDAVADAAEGGTQMALMILDLDRFKEINDTLGHHAGDLVLEALAQRLQTAVRSSDTVARLGGDEFAILLPQVADETAAVEMAARVQASLVESIDAGGIALDVDASIGIAISGQNGDDVATLLQHADIAMYRAKALDLGVCVYREAQNDNSREHLELLGELRRALDNNELVLHFQPKLRLKDSTLRGAEALVRWEHPTRGLLGPALFLAAAERTAMIGPLTRYVINAALAECQRWSEAGKHLRLAVNVSARNLLDVRFVDDVTELFGEWGLPRSCLMFEVTESAIMVEPKQAKATLTRFADLGIDIAIDDFGAGYTSLAHLRTLPVRELKIDQSLVAQMRFSAKDALIVRAVIDLARNLGLRTVAEGVEDETTLASVTLMGCDIAQGFHIAPPMTGAELSEWCAARETKALLLRT